MTQRGQYPDTFYRVSLKAFIVNGSNELLLNKELGHAGFSLPGGGIDHGETQEQSMARELFEEVGYEGAFTMKPVGICSKYHENMDGMLMWVVYQITPDVYDFSIGKDGEELKWVPLEHLYDETHSVWQELTVPDILRQAVQQYREVVALDS